MRISKSLATVAAASLLAAGGAVALAGPAAAIYEGPTLSGNILWFDQAGSLDTQTAAHMITSGKSPTNGVNPRPFQALALDQPCPAGTTNIALSMRVPQTGVPEDDWTEVLISPGVSTKDAEGRFYLNQVDVNGAFQVDRLNKSELLTYNLTSPGNTGQFPFIVSCKDDGAIPLGNFRTILTLTGTVANDYSWSIPASAFPAAPLTATTTTLAVSPTSGDAYSPVAFTATVGASAGLADGTVTYTDGSTTLGTSTVVAGVVSPFITSALGAGDHSLVAAFAGTAPFGDSSSAPVLATYDPTFVDVAPDAPFFSDITWLRQTGISTGSTNADGTISFRPVSPVSRQAMAAFLYRFAGSPPYVAPQVSPFSDVQTDSPFYSEIAWLAETGISTGTDLGGGVTVFRPTDPVSRQAMAAFLYRFDGEPAFDAPATSPFVDVATDSPFYPQIAWLASTGISTGSQVGPGEWQFRASAPVSRQAMAAFLHRADSLPPL